MTITSFCRYMETNEAFNEKIRGANHILESRTPKESMYPLNFIGILSSIPKMIGIPL